MEYTQPYKTRSLIIAAYLLATDKVHLLEVDRQNPKEAYFVLSDHNVCEELVNAYWSDKALVNPKTLNIKLTELKDQIFI